MKKTRSNFRAKFFLINFLALLLSSTNCFATNSRNLTVFAEPSMSLALTKIARLYSQQANVVISVNFNSSSELINDIDSGEPADVFISAHPQWVATLRQKGLVDVFNVGFIAKDSLALVTPKSNSSLPKELTKENLTIEEGLKIIDDLNLTLILDYEGNSSGKFSNDFISNLHFFDLKTFRKLAEDKSPILSTIKNDPTHYALLLSSQVNQDSDFKILATKGDIGIFYQALVIAGDNMEVAREFLKFLRGRAAKNILEQNGFNDG
jgi:molybdate transport system substrate-binding protein